MRAITPFFSAVYNQERLILQTMYETRKFGPQERVIMARVRYLFEVILFHRHIKHFLKQGHFLCMCTFAPQIS